MDTRAKNRFFIMLATLLFSTAVIGAGAAGNNAFDQLDTNKDGQLNATEASGDEALSSKWTEADQDQSGAIDRAEFSAFETMLENAVPAKPTTPKSGME